VGGKEENAPLCQARSRLSGILTSLYRIGRKSGHLESPVSSAIHIPPFPVKAEIPLNLAVCPYAHLAES